MVVLTTLVPVLAVQGAEWIMLPGGSPTPEPPTVEVVEHDLEHTRIHVEIPGFWVEQVEEEGILFEKVYLDEYGTTNYLGRPQLPVFRELLAIPGNSDPVVMVQNVQSHNFADYNIYPSQPSYPYSYEGPKPFYYDEEFYTTSDYYPVDEAEVGDMGYMKDFNTLHMITNPFRCIPAGEVLMVNYEYDVLYIYPGEGLEGDFTASVSPEYKNFYNNTLANSDFLNILVDPNAGNGYLIVTTDDYYNTQPYQDLVDLLVDRGFTIYEKHYVGPPMNWGDVYWDIRDIWINQTDKGFDYCLLIGDHDDIPVAENIPEWIHDRTWYSDFTYQCLKNIFDNPGVFPWEDWLPEINVGRISVNDTDEFQSAVDRLLNYCSIQGNELEPWENRILMVSHKGSKPTNNKRKIIDKEYYPDEMQRIPLWGDGSGYTPNPTNQNIINKINQGISLVNYLGHGKDDCWSEWNLLDEHFSKSDIISLQNTSYPLVFNYACNCGDIKFDITGEGDCLCETWITAENIDNNVGSVATTGCSGLYNCKAARTHDMYFFEAIFDPDEIPPDYKPVFGVLMNQATVKVCNELGKGIICDDDENYTPPVGCGPMHMIIYGDPSLEIRVNTKYNQDMGIVSEKISQDLIQSSFIVENLYPNPSFGEGLKIKIKSQSKTEVEVKIYDIAGRIILKNVRNLHEGDNLLDLNTSEMTSGIYIVEIKDDNTSEKRDFVVVR